MTAVVACLVVFAFAFLAGRRSLVTGLSAVLLIGYGYGIARANLATMASYFLFDAAILGLYVSLVSLRLQCRDIVAWRWFVALTVWPVVIFLVPFQDPVIQAVGLRGSVLFLPFILLGNRLSDIDCDRLALTIAALNIAAFLVAVLEFYFGIEAFYPNNDLTRVIFLSHDVADFSEYRIPATFTSAHAYGGAMAVTLPFLLQSWVRRVGFGRFQRGLLGVSIFVSVLGIFVSAARVHVFAAALMLVVVTFSGQVRMLARVGWVLFLALVAWVVASEERLQRVLTLRDSEFIVDRVGASLDNRFFDLLYEYPLGNGLGSGGTSIPAFLQDRLNAAVGLENEYSRILIEQGFVGLLLWVCFIGWIAVRVMRNAGMRDVGTALGFCCVMVFFATGLLGIGLLASVPAACLMLLLVGRVVRLDTRQSEARSGERGGIGAVLRRGPTGR